MTTAQAAGRMLATGALFSAVFVFLVFLFLKPRSRRDWRTLGMFSAFVVALFTEMFGFPLAAYFLSGWLSGAAGPETLPPGDAVEARFGWHSTPRLDPFPRAGGAVILAGLVLLQAAWPILYKAQRDGELAASGPYARIRHPQYAGIILVMLGMLLFWPTLLTLVLFLILAGAYVRLARREEAAALDRFGAAYAGYAARTPAFIPRIFLRHARS